MKRRYDLVVIGEGMAGLVSAGGAASLGAKVALAECDKLGGDCLYRGCSDLWPWRTRAKSGLKVDKHLRTTAENVYAAGDVSGKYLFTHVAESPF